MSNEVSNSRLVRSAPRHDRGIGRILVLGIAELAVRNFVIIVILYREVVLNAPDFLLDNLQFSQPEPLVGVLPR